MSSRTLNVEATRTMPAAVPQPDDPSDKGEVYLDVTDMMGNLIYTRRVERFNGFYEATINLSARASGVYLLRVRFGEEAFTQKLVLQR